jgi:choline dehydrogenase-like flavoprotein
MFDEIVVGAGTTGAVIASRLSEDPRPRVRLAEASPDYSCKGVMPPSILNGLTTAKDHDWGVPCRDGSRQKHGLSARKVVGGASAVNACLALRGILADYEEWAALGNTDWSWEQVQPVFCAIERSNATLILQTNIMVGRLRTSHSASLRVPRWYCSYGPRERSRRCRGSARPFALCRRIARCGRIDHANKTERQHEP